MAPRPIIESLVAHMKRDIAILEQLHILAQTQSLFLESGDLSGLTSVVEAKEKLVAQLVQAKSELATSLSQTDLKGIPELMALKERAFYLLQRISAVESGNQSRLQQFRATVIQQSQKLQEDRKLLKTYGSSPLS
jgi:hypothetical protein